MTAGEPRITPDKIMRFGQVLRDNLYEGAPEFRQAYARLLLQEVRVTKDEIRMSGSKAALARFVASEDGTDTSRVLPFVQKWRARKE